MLAISFLNFGKVNVKNSKLIYKNKKGIQNLHGLKF